MDHHRMHIYDNMYGMGTAELDEDATLFIGLGGTGIDCLRSIKRKIYERFRPDDPTASVPEYARYKFLAVDADVQDVQRRGAGGGDLGEIDPRSEFFDISCGTSVSNLFCQMGKELGADPVYREWLQYQKMGDMGLRAADNGAGGVRQLGRFLFMRKAADFVERVHQLGKQVFAATGGGMHALRVCVYTGATGGTGSGTFLDACYLIRHALAKLPYCLVGFVFLPDMNLSKPGLPEQVKAYIRENGYASLQELDYCMDFEGNGDEWHQEYPDDIGKITSKKQPVDMCYLVSASDGKLAPLYERAIDTASEFSVALFNRTNGYFFDGIYANVNHIRSSVPSPSGDYTALGAASLASPRLYPIARMASRVLGDIAPREGRVPSSSESEAFQKRIGFAFDPLLRDLLRGVDLSLPVPACRPADAHDDIKLVIGWFHDMEARAEGVLARNYAALSAEPGGYGPKALEDENAGSSLAARALAGLRDAMADPDRGPAYAAALLRGRSGSDLVAALRGVREEARSRRDHEQFQQDDHLNRDYKQAQSAFMNSNVLTRKKKYDAWVDAVRDLVLSQIQVKAYQKLMDLADAELAQLNAMADNFTDPFAALVWDASDQAGCSVALLERDESSRWSAERSIVPLSQLKEIIDDTCEHRLDVPAIERSVLERLLSDEGMKLWGPDGTYGVPLARVLRGVFKFFPLDLGTWLANRYEASTFFEKAVRFSREEVPKLMHAALPLIEFGFGFDNNCGVTMGFVLSPLTVLTQAVQGQGYGLGSGNPTVANDETRITVLNVQVGIPLQACKAYQDVKAADPTRPGTHLYESAGGTVTGDAVAGTPRDWRQLPHP